MKNGMGQVKEGRITFESAVRTGHWTMLLKLVMLMMWKYCRLLFEKWEQSLVSEWEG